MSTCKNTGIDIGTPLLLATTTPDKHIQTQYMQTQSECIFLIAACAEVSAGHQTKTHTPWRSSLQRFVTAVRLWQPLHDLNHRKKQVSHRRWRHRECRPRGGGGWGGQELEQRSESVKLQKWGKGWGKCSQWFALVCLLTVCSVSCLCAVANAVGKKAIVWILLQSTW